MRPRECLLPLFLRLLFLADNFRDCRSVLLHRLDVPQAVRNGTRTDVILDCHYSLNHSERDGIVLKWERNGRAIYQWIPPGPPQGLGMMRGKIDLDYQTNPAPLARYRALYLVSPITVEMTGDYTCKVATMQNEAQLTRRMVVYEPPRVFQLFHQLKLDQLNLTCFVDGVFPEPQIRIYLRRGGGRIQLKGLVERSDQHWDWSWRKSSFAVVPVSALESADNVFDCEVTLPEVNFVRRKSTLFSPGPHVMASASGASHRRRPGSEYHKMALVVVATALATAWR